MIPDEVVARRDGDLFVLDVRNEDDFEEWRVVGSYNVPIYDQLLDDDFTGLKDSLDEIPEDEETVVVCVAGVTSVDATEFLRERGYDAKSMEDGMDGWGRVHVAYEVEDADGVVQIVRPGTGCVSYLVHDGGKGDRRRPKPVSRRVPPTRRRARRRTRRGGRHARQSRPRQRRSLLRGRPRRAVLPQSG
nr:rhodanese-like domain-containing protein [Halorussus amylolyticus]